MKLRLKKVMGVMAAAGLVALSVSGVGAAGSASAAAPIKIGVALSYNNTAFWSAYIQYEQQFAKKMGVQLIGPLE